LICVPKLEANKVRKIMRIRVTEVFSLLWCIFGESMSVKKRKKYKELRRNFGRKRKEGMAICNSSRDDERFAFDH